MRGGAVAYEPGIVSRFIIPQDMNIPWKTSLLVALSLTMWLPSDGAAQGRHPRYLHARSDLRRAILLMRIPEEPNVMRDMQAASGLVERAIRELDTAAMFDAGILKTTPPSIRAWAAAAVSAKSCDYSPLHAPISNRKKTIPGHANGGIVHSASSMEPWPGFARAVTTDSPTP